MVYRGKPSANCKPCRDRRIKCNRQKPHCGQCLRRGLACYGYRLPEALRIRDQTDEVTRRLQECEQPAESPASPSLLDDTHLSIINLAPLSSDLKIQGLCYFMSYYGRPLSETLTNNTSYAILTKEAIDDPIVLAVSTAIGLAALANIHHDDGLAIKARQSYSTVIGSLSQALKVPLYATSDSALITSLLLSIFEILMCGEYQMIGVWGRHINGSTAIVRLRGLEQLQTHLGIGLFTRARTQAVTHCIQSGTKVPDFFKEWPSRALPGPLSPDSSLAEDLTCLSIRLVDLNSILRDASLQDYGYLLKTAHTIDEQLTQWGARFQDRWGYTTINSISVLQNGRRPSIELPTEEFYVYKNMWCCNQWNIYRTLRIMANSFALVMADKLPEELMTAYSFSDKCKQVVNGMAWGILASVPYCLGAIGDENLIGQASPMNSLGALNHFMKLYLFGNMPYVSDILRIKAVKTLRQIGEIHGIRFSSVLAETIER